MWRFSVFRFYVETKIFAPGNGVGAGAPLPPFIYGPVMASLKLDRRKSPNTLEFSLIIPEGISGFFSRFWISFKMSSLSTCEKEAGKSCDFLRTLSIVSVLGWFLYFTMSFKIGSFMLFILGSYLLFDFNFKAKSTISLKISANSSFDGRSFVPTWITIYVLDWLLWQIAHNPPYILFSLQRNSSRILCNS